MTNELKDMLTETEKSENFWDELSSDKSENSKGIQTSLATANWVPGKKFARTMSYNVHKERTDSTRFAKGQSQTLFYLQWSSVSKIFFPLYVAVAL
jgi:hypothetical protein